MERTEVLDQPDKNGYSSQKDAGKGKRLVNYIVDVIFFYVVYFLITLLIIAIFPNTHLFSEGPGLGLYVVTIAIFILYYSLLEYYLNGKTIGKLITRTRAIMEDGNKLSFSKSLARSACRLIPFEPFSFFGSKPRGWHDTLTDTRVIEDRN